MWSVECKVWSDVECKVWSVEHGMRHVSDAAPATQNNDGDLQNAARATETATHLVKATQSIARATQNDFRHVEQVGMSQSVTPATQNDMTTCLDTFEKERFCSLPHRHGEATGKPEARDETRGSIKRAFRARLPPILTLCSFKVDVFLRVFLRT